MSPGLKQAAGDCFDESQCKKCAVNVIRFVKAQAADEERQRQVELKKKRGIYLTHVFNLKPVFNVNIKKRGTSEEGSRREREGRTS